MTNIQMLEMLEHVFEELDGALLVRYDQDNGVLLAWFGGHGIHAYEMIGEEGMQEVNVWHIGDMTQDSASIDEVKAWMQETMVIGDYP